MIKIIKEKNKTYVVEDTISGRKESIDGIYKIFFTCLYSFIPDQQRGESLLNIEELDSDKFLIIETWEKSKKWFGGSRKLVNKELRLKNFLFHLPSDLKLGVFTDICYKTSSGDWILRDEYIGECSKKVKCMIS